MVVAGHAVGNRHWDLAIREGRLYVPTDGEAEYREDFLRSVLPEGAEIRVERVEPTVFDDSSDGAHGQHDHDHDHSHEHAHSHDHDRTVVTLDDVRRAARGGDPDG
jgi:urease accessory protein